LPLTSFAALLCVGGWVLSCGRHKDVMLTPQLLMAKGIRVYRTIQVRACLACSLLVLGSPGLSDCVALPWRGSRGTLGVAASVMLGAWQLLAPALLWPVLSALPLAD
jgi:hypothetical protein